MNGLDPRLDALILLGRQDRPPSVDVTDTVMRRIMVARVAVAAWERTWMWMAAVSTAVAAMAAIVAIPYCRLAEDPFAEVMQVVLWVTQ